MKSRTHFYYVSTSLYLFGFIFLFLSSLAYGEASDACHPKPDPALTQYIIGYGSIIQSQSKRQTDPSSGESRPVRIKGYRRGWFARGLSTGFSTTYLGIVPEKAKHFNGVFFRVNGLDSLIRYDQRERYYCRKLVPRSTMESLDGAPLPSGQFWVYALKPSAQAVPSTQYPIVQSYVDIFLSGCFEIAEKYHLKNFSTECVVSTTNWSKYWVNDRLYPRRPFVFEPKAIEIDGLLAKKVPETFSQVKIEGRN
jgi:hypothetical protein